MICCHIDLDGGFDRDGDNISLQVDLIEGLQLDRDPWGRRRSSRWQIFLLCLFSNRLQFSIQEDPVSTMQNTGWTNYSSFLVLSSL